MSEALISLSCGLCYKNVTIARMMIQGVAPSCSITYDHHSDIKVSLMPLVINHAPKVINYAPKVIVYAPKVINYAPKVNVTIAKMMIRGVVPSCSITYDRHPDY
jgi:hypothetical protein